MCRLINLGGVKGWVKQNCLCLAGAVWTTATTSPVRRRRPCFDSPRPSLPRLASARCLGEQCGCLAAATRTISRPTPAGAHPPPRSGEPARNDTALRAGAAARRHFEARAFTRLSREARAPRSEPDSATRRRATERSEGALLAAPPEQSVRAESTPRRPQTVMQPKHTRQKLY